MAKRATAPAPKDTRPPRLREADRVQPPVGHDDEPLTTEKKADATKSGPMVQVACKLPAGLWLELIASSPLLQPAPTGRRYYIKGANRLREDKRAAQGEYDYAITAVPKDFWDEWYKRNESLEFVQKGFVFAAPSLDHARGQGKEQAGELTGLEALAPEKDPRVLKIGKLGGGTDVDGDPESLARAQSAPM